MNNNPTAFPYMEISEDGVTLENHSGMTLRDWFAGQALNETIAQVMHSGATGDIAKRVAITAYQLADAMLAARKDA